MYGKPLLNICVAHSDALVAAGLVAVLRDMAGLTVCARTSGLPFAEFEAATFDILVIDYVAGLAILTGRRSAELRPGLSKVLIVTQVDREWEVRSAMNAGAHGYVLLKCGLDELLDAVLAIGRGSRYMCSTVSCSIADSFTRQELTAREAEVLHLLASGACNKTISKLLGIALGTVKAHVRGVREKLDATSRTHAVAIATQRGLVRTDSERPALPADRSPVVGVHGSQRPNPKIHASFASGLRRSETTEMVG